MNYSKETILIKNIEQLKQIIKNKSYNNYELVEPIMIKDVKCSKPESKAPEWFTEFVKEQREFNKRQEQFNQMVLDQFKKHRWIK